MTLTSTTAVWTFTGNDLATAFAYDAKILVNTDLKVTLRVDATGVETLQVLTTDYSVTGVGEDAGGDVVMVTAPATGETLIVERIAPITQAVDLRNQGGWFPETIEDALDKLTMISQQLDEANDRAIRQPVIDTADIGALPIASDRALKTLIFDASGDPTAGGVTGSVVSAAMEPVVASATLAAARTAMDVVEDVTTTRGDIIAADATPAPSRIAIGAANTVLRSDGTDPAWAAVDGTVLAIPSAAIGDVLAYNGTAWVRIPAGTAGYVFQANGAAAPTWVPKQSVLIPTLDTEQATTSGTSVTFSAPGSGSVVYRITVHFEGVSTDQATNRVDLRLGDSGGIESTGYVGSFWNTGGFVLPTSEFQVANNTGGGTAIHGHCVLTLMDAATFTYSCSGTVFRGDVAGLNFFGGTKATSAALTQLEVSTPAGAFDAGAVNVLWEEL